MITNLDPASELFLSNVNRIQQRLADANRQVASGKKIVAAVGRARPDRRPAATARRPAAERADPVQPRARR